MSENEIDFKRLAQYIGTDSETGLESCNFCHRIFHGKHLSTRRRSLMNHIDSVHEGIRYNCDQCQHQSTTKNNLWKHVKSVHSGVTYDCNMCEKKFSQKMGLKKHVQHKHEGVKYHCSQCGEYRRSKLGLQGHMKLKHNLASNIIMDDYIVQSGL